MVSINDVLKASKGVPVDDIFAQLWGRKLSSDYTIAVYTGTLPAVLTGTKEGYLQRYKVYGNVGENLEECGERTENLVSSPIVQGGWEGFNGRIPTAYNTGQYFPIRLRVNGFVSIDPNKTYSIRVFPSSLQIAIKLCNSDKKEFIDTSWITDYTTITGAFYIVVTVRKSDNSNIAPEDCIGIVVSEGSTPQTSYIPNGYKLPLTSGNTPIDIYIGDDTLSTEEYVDSGTGKIYRMVSGVLTPVDPPVPFPQIPTSAGSTTISWAGEGLAPSEVEFEYERA